MAQQNKEHQKKLLTEIMEADQKNGLYDIPSIQKKMTAVEWLVRKFSMELIGEIPLHRWDEIREAIQQAKQMEEEQKYETSAFWFGRGILAGKENRIEELKPIKE